VKHKSAGGFRNFFEDFEETESSEDEGYLFLNF
jgi:hypothetical protein